VPSASATSALRKACRTPGARPQRVRQTRGGGMFPTPINRVDSQVLEICGSLAPLVRQRIQRSIHRISFDINETELTN